MKELIKLGEKLGFSYKQTKSGHLLFSGHGHRIVTASTPGDFRIMKSLRKNFTKLAAGKPVGRL